MEGEELKKALQQARPDLEAGLQAAEIELRQLDERRTELIDLIQRAKAALGILPAPAAPTEGSRGQTLHGALAQILRERGNEWMSARELAAEVNERGLYQKRDGSPVDPGQISARTQNYQELFEKADGRIRLREG